MQADSLLSSVSSTLTAPVFPNGLFSSCMIDYRKKTSCKEPVMFSFFLFQGADRYRGFLKLIFSGKYMSVFLKSKVNIFTSHKGSFWRLDASQDFILNWISIFVSSFQISTDSTKCKLYISCRPWPSKRKQNKILPKKAILEHPGNQDIPWTRQLFQGNTWQRKVSYLTVTSLTSARQCPVALGLNGINTGQGDKICWISLTASAGQTTILWTIAAL